MAFTAKQLRQALVLCRWGTTGGATYYIDNNPYCLASLESEGKRDLYCEQPAGRGTDHLGTGRCKNHGGAIFNAQQTQYGRYSRVTKETLGYLYSEFMDEADMLNLLPELGMQRTLLTSVMQIWQDDPRNVGLLKMASQMLDTVSQMVERIERIQSNHVLTVATARLLMLRAVDVAKHYIPQDRMQEFLDEWKRETIVIKDVDSSRLLEV